MLVGRRTRTGMCCSGSTGDGSEWGAALMQCRRAAWSQLAVTVTSSVSDASGGTVHGVASPGAQLTSNWAVTTDDPGATAVKTAVADPDDGEYESPARTAPSETVGAAVDQEP